MPVCHGGARHVRDSHASEPSPRLEFPSRGISGAEATPARLWLSFGGPAEPILSGQRGKGVVSAQGSPTHYFNLHTLFTFMVVSNLVARMGDEDSTNLWPLPQHGRTKTQRLGTEIDTRHVKST